MQKVKYLIVCLIILSCFLISSFFSKKKAPAPPISSYSFNKIAIDPTMIINETVYGDARKLVDEQSVIGNPALGNGGKPKSTWSIPNNRKKLLPFSAVIDLGQYYFISDIYIYDAEGEGHLIVSSGEPFQWKEKAIENLDKNNIWKSHSINDTTRFLQIKLEEIVSTPEISLYGVPILSKTKEKTKKGKKEKKAPASTGTMDELIGINAFIDDPVEKIKVANFVREYHSWAWDEGGNQPYKGYPENKNAWAPSYAAGGSWNFDTFYKVLKSADINVVPCIQGGVDWIADNRHVKPILSHANPFSPASYIAHADHMFQTVARYGSAQVDDDALLKLRADQERKSGLGLIQYFENWNEPNNDWSGKENYFTPYQFAAMCSADYDGHLSALGKDKGVKNADPKAKMVMGGLASLNLKYLKFIKAMKFWADYNRNGSIPFDVINFHHYSNNRESKRGYSVTGISPEEDSLKQKLTEIVEYRDREMPGKEIWLTEFGYDTHPKSPQRAPAIGSMTQEEVQAIWLVRSFLEIAASGIDRAAMYMLRDVSPESSTKYQNSGLTSSKATGQKPKTSWYYVYTLKNALTGMSFEKEIMNKAVNIYKFEDKNAREKAYVVWSPTSKDVVINNFDLFIEEKENSKVEVISFLNKSISGQSDVKKPLNGKITLEISETPKIVKVSY